MLEPFLNIGHRGSPLRAPENTLASFRQAVNDGANWLELDVRLSSDQVVVVCHDADLKRTCGMAHQVKKLPAHRMKSLDAGSWFHPDYKTEGLPSLQEVIESFPRTGLNIEIKALGMEKALAQVLASSKCLDRVIISCFMFTPLRRIQALLPPIRTGILLHRRLGLKRKVLLAKKYGMYSVHPEHNLLTPEILALCQKSELAMIPWHERPIHEGRLRQLLSLPIQGLISDFPMAVSYYLDKLRISSSSNENIKVESAGIPGTV